jgi:hypothetical protein
MINPDGCQRLYLSPEMLVKILRREEPASKPVGFAYLTGNKPVHLFIATDRDTGDIVQTKKGDIALDVKPVQAKTSAPKETGLVAIARELEKALAKRDSAASELDDSFLQGLDDEY